MIEITIYLIDLSDVWTIGTSMALPWDWSAPTGLHTICHI